MSMPVPSARAARAAISAVFFVNGFGFATWVSRIPAVRASLDLSEGELGTALLAIAGGAIIAFPLAGRASVIKGARLITLATSVAYCLALPAPAVAGSFALLALALLLFGIVNGAMDVSMNALAVEVETLAGKPIMSSLHGMWSAGGLTGAAIGGLFARYDVSPPLHLSGVALALMLVVLLAQRWLPQSQAHPSPEAVPHFVLPEAGMMGLGAIVFCGFLIEGAMADWSAVFLHDVLNTSAAVAALGYAVYSLTMMSMRFAGDRVVVRWGPVPLLRYANTAGAVLLAAALWTQHLALTMVTFAVIGVAMATVAPLVFGAAARRSHHGGGHGIAAMATIGYTGFLIGPPLVGWLAEASSLRVALGVLALLSILIATFAYHLREPGGQP